MNLFLASRIFSRLDHVNAPAVISVTGAIEILNAFVSVHLTFTLSSRLLVERCVPKRVSLSRNAECVFKFCPRQAILTSSKGIGIYFFIRGRFQCQGH